MDREKSLVVMKIGGRAAESEALKALAKEMAFLEGRHRFLIVLGGGAEVTRISRLFGLSPRFIDGIRMTTAEEMEVVDMVLAGKINKKITRIFRTAGLNALGLSGSDGGLFTGTALEESSHTGRVDRVNRKTLEALLGADFLPVVSSTSMEAGGKALNINADEAAIALASAHPAKTLLFVSDIPGVLGSGQTVLPQLNEAAAAEAIDQGLITGGMIPKVQSSLKALRGGVETVIIGSYEFSGDLSSFMEGRGGTRIEL